MSYNQLLYDKVNINEKKDELLISLLNDFCNKSNNTDSKMFELICNQLISLGLISETTFYKLQLVPEIKDNYINILKNLTNNENDIIESNIKEFPSPIQNFYSQYEVKEKIGSGGFGVVYKIFNKLDDNHYALKKIKLDSNSESVSVLREVQALSKLDHPNIIRYNTCWLGYDTENQQDDLDDLFSSNSQSYDTESPLLLFLYIQMELCDSNLEKYIDNREIIDHNDNLIIFTQLCEGLNYIHENHFIHRDIKPGNIFMKNNVIKIGDFGLVKKNYKSSDNALTLKDSNHSIDIGTKTYASPEQIDNKFYTHKTDLYSLGIILLELSLIVSTVMEKIEIFNKARKDKSFPDLLDKNLVELIRNLMNDNPDLRSELKIILKLDLKKILSIT